MADGASCDALPGIVGLGPDAAICAKCKEQCKALKGVGNGDAYVNCFLSCATANNGSHGPVTQDQSQVNAGYIKCQKQAIQDTINKFGSVSDQQATDFYDKAYQNCLSAAGLNPQSAPPNYSSQQACQTCGVTDLPSCFICAADTMSKGLVTIGINLFLGILVLLGLYLLFHDTAAVKAVVEASKKAAKKGAEAAVVAAT